MVKFLSVLDVRCKDDRTWILAEPLIYESDILGRIEVPRGFETDFASVPRMPIFYMFYGDRAHMESVLHDYLYRNDCAPPASFMQANRVFLEAMAARGKAIYVRWPMFLGVVIGGLPSYHRRNVGDKL